MADEQVLIHEMDLPIPFTCTNATGIEKGTLLKLTDPMTVIIASGEADMIAGVAAEEKIASDGRTKIGVYMRGIFKAKADGTIAIGAGVITDGTKPNELITATAAADAAAICGIALEAAVDGDTFLYYLNMGIGGSPET